MARVERFEDLIAWQCSRELVKQIYRVTSSGRFARDFALTDQIRRAAISVGANIAEGFERGGDKEFFQFLANAKGSAGELRAQIYMAGDQAYLSPDECRALLDQALEASRLIVWALDFALWRGDK